MSINLVFILNVEFHNIIHHLSIDCMKWTCNWRLTSSVFLQRFNKTFTINRMFLLKFRNLVHWFKSYKPLRTRYPIPVFWITVSQLLFRHMNERWFLFSRLKLAIKLCYVIFSKEANFVLTCFGNGLERTGSQIMKLLPK